MRQTVRCHAPLRHALLSAALLLAATTASVHAEAEEVEHYGSLEELAGAADAVVVGQMVASVRGRVFSGCANAAATLRVDEVLAGSVGFPAPVVTVEYFDFCGELPTLGDGIPVDRGVFFLRNKATDVRLYQPGATQAEVDAERPFWRLAIGAGTVVERAGRVHVPVTYNAEWLEPWEGKPFADLVGAVRAAAPAPPGVAPASADASSSPRAPLLAGIFVVGALVALVACVAVVARRRGLSRQPPGE